VGPLKMPKYLTVLAPIDDAMIERIHNLYVVLLWYLKLLRGNKSDSFVAVDT
jgi:hypothetical protein